jgi:DNA polymerase III alpha subunit
MKNDIYGQQIFDQNDLCNLFLQDPTRVIDGLLMDEVIDFSKLELFDDSFNNFHKITKYVDPNISVEEYDTINQKKWLMPEKYYQLDIAKWVLDQCENETELQRAGAELIKFQERGMFVLLQYLKYLVDTMRENNIVWGVGRGSSIASFVLFLIGIHRINSITYDLSIDEFLK